MKARSPSNKAIAEWRHQQVESAVADDLTRAQRSKILQQISKTPVHWPHGQVKAVSVATGYRWVRAYRQGGLEALRPKRRSDRGVARAALPQAVVDKAVSLLTDDCGLSFTLLLALLCPLFPKVRICRSTLHDQLRQRPEYQQVRRLQKRTQRRTRFVAKAPHDIWQTDAKGPFSVALKCGKRLLVHVISIIDDATRAVLATRVALSANLAAAVGVFRTAATRWGLPNKLYADRASIFDAHAFRRGLAQLGPYRIPTKPRNAAARGKIEAYHRTLERWFCKRLLKQVVVDLVHLQQLLEGVIFGVYQTHYHRGLKMSPEQALAERTSDRVVPPSRLVDAFRQERSLKTHRKTGEVDISGVTYLVPEPFGGMRLTFLIDPPGDVPPQFQHPESEKVLDVRRAAVRPEDLDAIDEGEPPLERWGEGNLQAIYDNWQGKRRPQAEPGFGLPEIYALLTRACARHVPHSDAEAALIQRVYSNIGPLPHKATTKAFDAIVQQLGHQRPVKTYLDALTNRVHRQTQKQRT